MPSTGKWVINNSFGHGLIGLWPMCLPLWLELVSRSDDRGGSEEEASPSEARIQALTVRGKTDAVRGKTKEARSNR